MYTSPTFFPQILKNNKKPPIQEIDWEALYYAKRDECLAHWVTETKTLALACQLEVALAALLGDPLGYDPRERALELLNKPEDEELDREGLISLFLFLMLTLTDWMDPIMVKLAQSVPAESERLKQVWFAGLWGATEICDIPEAIEWARRELVGAEVEDR